MIATKNKNLKVISIILLTSLITISLGVREIYGLSGYIPPTVKRVELKADLNPITVNLKMETIRKLTEVGINGLKVCHFKSLIMKELENFDSLHTSPKFNDLMTKTFLSFALTCQVQKCELEIDPNSPENKQKAYEIIDAVFNEMKVKLKEQFPNYCININSNSNSDQQIDNNSN